jgi:hypothetical protein
MTIWIEGGSLFREDAIFYTGDIKFLSDTSIGTSANPDYAADIMTLTEAYNNHLERWNEGVIYRLSRLVALVSIFKTVMDEVL